MKLWKRVLILLLLIPALLAAALAGVYLWADNSPFIVEGYQETIKTGGDLEEKYLQTGSFDTLSTTERADGPIGEYSIFYPEELESTDRTYPLLVVVNGTGGKATRYSAQFELYASWGFIVVGTQDKGTGSGATTVEVLNHLVDLNASKESRFYDHIDLDNIGLTGFSQGGAAIMNVLTKYDEARLIKAAAPLSPVSEKTTRESTDYTYDSAGVDVPIMMMAGTRGEFETEVVIPLDELNSMYDKIPSPKVMARRTGMDHDQMMYSAGGYVIAWFLWQLQDDDDAARAFIGDNPELLSNPLYQDQRSDLE